MARKKDFTIGGAPLARITTRSTVDARADVDLRLPLPHGETKTYSFSDHLGHGYDEIVHACVQSIEQMIRVGRPEPYSLRTTIESGLRHWFAFCRDHVNGGAATLALGSVEKRTIESFIAWLHLRVKPDGERWSLNTARTVYAKVKIVLGDLCARRLLPSDDFFPPNPFPRATAPENRRAYICPLSDREREHIIKALAAETSQIFDGTHASSLRVRLAPCAFAILLKTGLNPTPLLELPRDPMKAFMDHPRVNRRILVTFKRRAEKNTPTPLEPAESRVVSLDVYRLYLKVAELTALHVGNAGDPHIAERLWIFEQADGRVRGLSVEDLSGAATDFTNRHMLVRDDGTRLKMTSQLFRNTRINRIWRASKGDLLATARSAGHTPAVTDRYLAVTPDMLEEHRLAGEVMVQKLAETGRASLAKTPVASCRDPYGGDRAPNNRSPCVDFLSCFRCKSQVITSDDLYRLFSFYWAVLNERERIGAKNWRKVFAWIVRIIDRDVAPRFNDQKMVQEAKTRARHDPHPMWRSREALLAIGSVL
jgi:hypothetical protein